MARNTTRETTYRTALSALLLAMMLILGYVESMIPLNASIPGIKLGLSNGVLIFAVYMLDIPAAYTLMALKVLLSGMMFGSPSMMMYGFAGGLLSLTGMCLLSRIRLLPATVVSLAGGILHNAGQVGLAILITRTPGLAGYLLVLIVVGAMCGVLTGVCATLVMKHLKTAGLHRFKGKGPSRRRAAAIALVCVLLTGIWAGYLLHKSTAQKKVTWSSDGPPAIELPLR